jgi:hypothetical protein
MVSGCLDATGQALASEFYAQAVNQKPGGSVIEERDDGETAMKLLLALGITALMLSCCSMDLCCDGRHEAREATREARDAAREAAREAREAAREAAEEAREAHREAVRETRQALEEARREARRAVREQ